MTQTTVIVNDDHAFNSKTYIPKLGDILVTRNNNPHIVTITDYVTDFKLISIKDGGRWSDKPIGIAITTLEQAHGPLRIAKKATISFEF